MSTNNQLDEMLEEHDKWQKQILSYRKELDKFNSILGNLISKNNDKDQLRKIEHFQNQFILQTENLDILRHDFKQHENSIEALQGEKAINPDIKINKVHENQRSRLVEFDKIFKDLSTEFDSFQTN